MFTAIEFYQVFLLTIQWPINHSLYIYLGGVGLHKGKSKGKKMMPPINLLFIWHGFLSFTLLLKTMPPIIIIIFILGDFLYINCYKKIQ